VYILQSADGSYYIGQTNNLENRFRRHNAGQVRSTKGKTPWTLVYFEEYPTRIEAMKRERAIKARKSRDYILRLVRTSRPARNTGREDRSTPVSSTPRYYSID